MDSMAVTQPSADRNNRQGIIDLSHCFKDYTAEPGLDPFIDIIIIWEKQYLLEKDPQ